MNRSYSVKHVDMEGMPPIFLAGSMAQLPPMEKGGNTRLAQYRGVTVAVWMSKIVS
jgi:hypothetical protein